MYYNIWLAVLYDNHQFKQFYPRNKKNKKERQFCSHFCIYRRWIHFASTNHVTSSTFHHDLSMFWLISTPLDFASYNYYIIYTYFCKEWSCIKSHYPCLGLLLQITVFTRGMGSGSGVEVHLISENVNIYKKVLHYISRPLCWILPWSQNKLTS